jgi:hypothetical protein
MKMKSLQVNNLLLYPRIRKSVKDSLDGIKNITIIEHNIKMTSKQEEIHTILFTVMQACLDELKS